MWEYFPQNAMLMFFWGIVFGTGRNSKPSVIENSSIPTNPQYQ
jgi:hypothetical protein